MKMAIPLKHMQEPHKKTIRVAAVFCCGTAARVGGIFRIVCF